MCCSLQRRRHSTPELSRATRLSEVSEECLKWGCDPHTAVEAAFVWASLVLVGQVCASVLIRVACQIVPARIAAQAYVTEQAAGGRSTVQARYQFFGSAMLWARSKIALLLSQGPRY